MLELSGSKKVLPRTSMGKYKSFYPRSILSRICLGFKSFKEKKWLWVNNHTVNRMCVRAIPTQNYTRWKNYHDLLCIQEPYILYGGKIGFIPPDVVIYYLKMRCSAAVTALNKSLLIMEIMTAGNFIGELAAQIQR